MPGATIVGSSSMRVAVPANVPEGETLPSCIREVDGTELKVRCGGCALAWSVGACGGVPPTPPKKEVDLHMPCTARHRPPHHPTPPNPTLPTQTPRPTHVSPSSTPPKTKQPGDSVWFVRGDGIRDEGVVIDLKRDGTTVFARLRYKDVAWKGYTEQRDVEELLREDQMVQQTRTRRPSQPVTRFEPRTVVVSRPGNKPAAKGAGAKSGKSSTKLSRQQQAAEEKKARRREQRRKAQKRAKARAARKERKRVLGMAFLSSGRLDGANMTEADRLELMKLLKVDNPLDIQKNLNFNSDDDSADAGSDGDDDMSVGSSSSSASSVFGEEDSSDEAESSSEEELALSDVSTESYASDPDFTFWKHVKDPSSHPGKAQLRSTGFKRFGLAPKYDSEDSSDSDEEPQEMGLTATVGAYSESECKALLREYLHRRRSVERREKTGAMSYKEWCLALRLISEDSGGVSALESQQAIKGVKRCDGRRTMYGAIRAPLIQEMIQFAQVRKEDRFIDIGSGLGTVVLQMAAVTGCKATGIELEESRYTLSSMLNEELIKTMEELEGREARGFIDDLKSRISMINGDIRQYEQEIISSTRIYFNNHGVWFDETASKQGEISVEHWVAKLFAKTAIGTRLVILKSMPHLKGNWFKEEKYVAQASWLTWARDDKPLFCYTKLKNTWTCEKCKHENAVVPDNADYSLIWEMRCVNNCASRVQSLRVRPGAGGRE